MFEFKVGVLGILKDSGYDHPFGVIFFMGTNWGMILFKKFH